MTKSETNINVRKMFEPTIDNAIRDMKMSKLLFLTKDNKFYSMISSEYLEDKKKFLPFIKEEKQKEFMDNYAQVFQEVGTEPDTIIALKLLNWEHSGNIMMLLSDDTDWKVVDETLHNQGHSGSTINSLYSKIVYFSPYGLDFIEHLFGVEERLKAEKEISNIEKSSF